MNQSDTNYIILFTALIMNSFGCLVILKKNWFCYGLVLIFSLVGSSGLCLLFYSMDFYRFTLPIQLVLPVAAISFSFLALFIIRFRPLKWTFPFFFITLTMIFSIEVLLKDFFGFIQFKNGWDYWDSYSLYWIYARLFDHIGEYIVPVKDKSPIKSDTKRYRIIFVLIVIYAGLGVYILNQGWTKT